MITGNSAIRGHVVYICFDYDVLLLNIIATVLQEEGILSNPPPSRSRSEARRRKKISRTVERRVFAQYGYACDDCGVHGTEAELTVDHIYPHSLGGSDDEINLRPLCRSCNSRKRYQGPGTERVEGADQVRRPLRKKSTYPDALKSAVGSANNLWVISPPVGACPTYRICRCADGDGSLRSRSPVSSRTAEMRVLGVMLVSGLVLLIGAVVDGESTRALLLSALLLALGDGCSCEPGGSAMGKD